MQVLGGNICIPQFFLLSLHLEMGIMERIPEKLFLLTNKLNCNYGRKILSGG